MAFASSTPGLMHAGRDEGGARTCPSHHLQPATERSPWLFAHSHTPSWRAPAFERASLPPLHRHLSRTAAAAASATAASPVISTSRFGPVPPYLRAREQSIDKRRVRWPASSGVWRHTHEPHQRGTPLHGSGERRTIACGGVRVTDSGGSWSGATSSASAGRHVAASDVNICRSGARHSTVPLSASRRGARRRTGQRI